MKIYWTPRIYQASLRGTGEQEYVKCNVRFPQLLHAYFGLGLFVSTVDFLNKTLILYASYLRGLRYL